MASAGRWRHRGVISPSQDPHWSVAKIAESAAVLGGETHDRTFQNNAMVPLGVELDASFTLASELGTVEVIYGYSRLALGALS